MGLGKTLQIIALVSQRRMRDAGRPSLVIVPATLIENWGRELAKFAPTLRVYRHVGGARTRRPSEIAKADVVLTTYETAVIDQPVLEQVRWDILVADEAQAIKNPETQRSIALRSLPREGAFAVTGTPLENRTLDTWSLADFALPGYLGSRSEFASALESEPELLRRALKPLVLRREVEQVASDLPEKIEIDVALEMFAGEKELYESVTDAIRGDKERVPILALLTKLRMFTAHPDAVHGTAPQPENRSAKLTRLLEILDELHERGSKSLVFVAFNQPADIVVSAIQRRVGIPVWSIDGRTPVAERQSIVDQFSRVAGSAVLVLNPAAAGTGLNIQAANHIVHYTLEWNPAREAQATARAWRRGQERPVTVHRLFYVSSIDELIVDRLTLKQELFDAVVQASDPDSDISLRTLLDHALGLGPQREREPGRPTN
jgi:SNF2 family DNA or RNA helicase